MLKKTTGKKLLLVSPKNHQIVRKIQYNVAETKNRFISTNKIVDYVFKNVDLKKITNLIIKDLK